MEFLQTNLNYSLAGRGKTMDTQVKDINTVISTYRLVWSFFGEPIAKSGAQI